MEFKKPIIDQGEEMKGQSDSEETLLIKCLNNKSLNGEYEMKIKLYAHQIYEKEVPCDICKKTLRFKMNARKLDLSINLMLLGIIGMSLMGYWFMNEIFALYGLTESIIVLFMKFSILFIPIALGFGLLAGRIITGFWGIQKGAELQETKEGGSNNHLVRRKSIKKLNQFQM